MPINSNSLIFCVFVMCIAVELNIGGMGESLAVSVGG